MKNSKILEHIALFIFLLITLPHCKSEMEKENTVNMTSANFKSGYSEVNGITMYYEIYGQGKPLVLLHGGGSTIQSTFEKVIPEFAKTRQVIAVELQAHGRTSDRNADATFEQDADDVATLLKNLNIQKADVFGFSNGGTTTLQLAIRHPQLVNQIVLGSALAKRTGVPAQFWEFMKNASLDNMPAELKEAYKKVAKDSSGLQLMHDRDAKRMVNFTDIPDNQLTSIHAPALIIQGDKDVITLEHAIELHRILKGSQLAIIPGGHGAYIGEITTLQSGTDIRPAVALIENFLNQ